FGRRASLIPPARQAQPWSRRVYPAPPDARIGQLPQTGVEIPRPMSDRRARRALRHASLNRFGVGARRAVTSLGTPRSRRAASSGAALDGLGAISRRCPFASAHTRRRAPLALPLPFSRCT